MTRTLLIRHPVCCYDQGKAAVALRLCVYRCCRRLAVAVSRTCRALACGSSTAPRTAARHARCFPVVCSSKRVSIRQHCRLQTKTSSALNSESRSPFGLQGDLFSAIKRKAEAKGAFTENEVMDMFIQIASGEPTQRSHDVLRFSDILFQWNSDPLILFDCNHDTLFHCILSARASWNIAAPLQVSGTLQTPGRLMLHSWLKKTTPSRAII